MNSWPLPAGQLTHLLAREALEKLWRKPASATTSDST
jgi:hypothetical protein